MWIFWRVSVASFKAWCKYWSKGYKMFWVCMEKAYSQVWVQLTMQECNWQCKIAIDKHGLCNWQQKTKQEHSQITTLECEDILKCVCSTYSMGAWMCLHTKQQIRWRPIPFVISDGCRSVVSQKANGLGLHRDFAVQGIIALGIVLGFVLEFVLMCVLGGGGGAEVTKSKGEQSHICIIFIDPRLMIHLPA